MGDGRTSFALDAPTAALLKAHIERLEKKLGFRPSINQTVARLIRQADSSKGTHP